MRYLPGLAWRGLAAVALAACAATAAAADITLEKIKHTGVITIGNEEIGRASCRERV